MSEPTKRGHLTLVKPRNVKGERHRRKLRREGRPDAYTPDLATTVVRYVAAGNYLETACILAGVSKQTVYVWLRLGRKYNEKRFLNGKKYGQFLDQMTRAEAGNEASHVAGIVEAGGRDWRARAWLLEHRHSQRWGKREHLDHTGAVAVITDPQVTRDAVKAALGSDDVTRELADKLVDRLTAAAIQSRADGSGGNRRAVPLNAPPRTPGENI